MSDEERARRPKLDRSEPIRSFSSLIGGGRSTRTAEKEGQPSLGDAFSRAVDVGYRVIDEYIRQGQRAAELLRKGEYDAQAATSDFQDLAVRMTRSASDMMETWLQLMSGVAGAGGTGWGMPGSGRMNGGSPGNGQAAASGTGVRWTDPPREPARQSPTNASPAAAAPTPATEDARLRIEVSSTRPTEVFVDLRAGASSRRLRVHALRSVDSDKPRLEAVLACSATADEPAVLKIQVPQDHPPGAYHGLILDEEANRPLGTLTVKITAADDAES
jgi:hypothetical protein